MNNNQSQHQPVKAYNQYLLLDLIRTKGPISRVQLAALTGLSTAAVTILINNLLEHQFIHEIGTGESQQGRKPILLEINPKAKHVIGIDIGHVSIRVCIADLCHQIIERREIEFDLHNNYELLSTTVTNLALDLLKFADNNGYSVSGIGIVMPGTLIIPARDSKNGLIYQRICVDWKSLSLEYDVEKATGLKVFLANATDAAALAESLFGLARGANRLVYVTIGSGVKAGVVLHNRAGVDELGYTPEFGHTTIDIDGEECWCGNIGCLEMYISEKAILHSAKQAINKYPDSQLAQIPTMIPEQLTVNHIFNASKMEDPAAKEVIAGLVRYLGAGLVSLVNLYAPDLILIGAREMQVDHLDLLSEPLGEIVRQRAMPLPAERVQIGIGLFGGDAYLMGALSIVFREIFSPYGEIDILVSNI